MQKLPASKLAVLHPLFPVMMSVMLFVMAACFAAIFAQVEAVHPPECAEFSKDPGEIANEWVELVVMGRPWFGLWVGLAVGCVAHGFEKRKWRMLLQDPGNIQRQADLLRLRPLPAISQTLFGRNLFAFSWATILGLLTVIALSFLLRFSLTTSICAFGCAWILLGPEYRRLYDGVLGCCQRDEASKDEQLLLLQRVKRRVRIILLLEACLVVPFCMLLVYALVSVQDLSTDLDLRSSGRYCLVSTGEDLTPEEAAEVDRRFERNPGNPNPRCLLLGYYTKRCEESDLARKEHERHALWYIRTYPRDYHARSCGASILTPQGSGEAAAIWREHVERWPEDVGVVAGAADFFWETDEDLAVDLFERAASLEPEKPWWQNKLGRIHASGLHAKPAVELVDTAKRSLAAYERAVELTEGDTDKLRLLVPLAPVAFEAEDYDRARSAAQEILGGAGDLRYQEYGWAVHIADTVLGRLALHEGDVSGAEEHLRQSLAGLDADDRETFEPQFTLAEDLLSQGHSQPVLEFLAECAKLWNAPEYEDWAAAIREGRTPDFGEAVEGGPE
jgi:tetratricopeptide (TPR) repeat protein